MPSLPAEESLDADRALVGWAFSNQATPPALALFAAARLVERWSKQSVSKTIEKISADTGSDKAANPRRFAQPDVDGAIRLAHGLGLLTDDQQMWCHSLRLLGNAARHDPAPPDEEDRALGGYALLVVASVLQLAHGDDWAAASAKTSRVATEIALSLSGNASDLNEVVTALQRRSNARRRDAWRQWLVRRCIETGAWNLCDRLLSFYGRGSGGAWRPKFQRSGLVGGPVRLQALRLSRAGYPAATVELLRREAGYAGYLGGDSAAETLSSAGPHESTFDFSETLGILAGALRRRGDGASANLREQSLHESLGLYRRVYVAQPWNTYAGINAAINCAHLGNIEQAQEIAKSVNRTLVVLDSACASPPMWNQFSRATALLLMGNVDEARKLQNETIHQYQTSRPGDCESSIRRWLELTDVIDRSAGAQRH